MRDSMGVWLVLQDPHFAGVPMPSSSALLCVQSHLHILLNIILDEFACVPVEVKKRGVGYLGIPTIGTTTLDNVHNSAFYVLMFISCAVPGILLLASVAGLAVVLLLQQKHAASNGHTNGHIGKGEPVEGGTAFVEDGESGLQVRRSKRYATCAPWAALSVSFCGGFFSLGSKLDRCSNHELETADLFLIPIS